MTVTQGPLWGGNYRQSSLAAIKSILTHVENSEVMGRGNSKFHTAVSIGGWFDLIRNPTCSAIADQRQS